MTVQLVWEDVNKRVLRFDLDATWTWDEFFVAKTQSYDLINTVPHKVGVIINIASRTALKPNLLLNTRKALVDKHPNTFVVVVVVTDALARTAIGLLYDSIRFSSMRVEIADSLDEARRIIEKRQQEQAALPDQS
jgi:hypothetical protein